MYGKTYFIYEDVYNLSKNVFTTTSLNWKKNPHNKNTLFGKEKVPGTTIIKEIHAIDYFIIDR